VHLVAERLGQSWEESLKETGWRRAPERIQDEVGANLPQTILLG
jgi:hypothetical protein